MRLITALSSTSRNSRGRGLPACGSGVTVPISTKPKPKPNIACGTSAFLSKPGASPTGVGKSSPATRIASTGSGAGGAEAGARRSAASVNRCAVSPSSRKMAGRASENSMACLWLCDGPMVKRRRGGLPRRHGLYTLWRQSTAEQQKVASCPSHHYRRPADRRQPACAVWCSAFAQPSLLQHPPLRPTAPNLPRSSSRSMPKTWRIAAGQGVSRHSR